MIRGEVVICKPKPFLTKLRAERQLTIHRPPQKSHRNWFYLFGAVCLFMFGEEISWGQRLLGFATPDWMNRQNYQGEFTLHNMKLFQPGRQGAEQFLSDEKHRTILRAGHLRARSWR